ncbi:hypothetical protein T07_3014 [Trichinella nelsoni]|uniref:Uncharacterized protein n=1 Tax=Trichinella nelsoni TaxID=6336 RepID=A0A0V0RB93_9BILA|nr:hypothetical protein T07_3014 [Trichinella nelsoni]
MSSMYSTEVGKVINVKARDDSIRKVIYCDSRVKNSFV